MKSSEILITARALINTPERWVKGRKPGCWCAGDAIMVAPYCGTGGQRIEGTGYLGSDGAYARDACNAALKALKCAIGNGHEIVSWNDAPERTHDEVMAAFDRAIAAEQAKEPQ